MKKIFIFLVLVFFIPRICISDSWVEILVPQSIRANFTPARVFVEGDNIIITGRTRAGGFSAAISSADNGATWNMLQIPSLNMYPSSFNVGTMGTYCVISSYHGNEKISAIDENNIEWGLLNSFGYPFSITQRYARLYNNRMYVQGFFPPSWSVGKLVAINRNNSYNIISDYMPGVVRYISFRDSINVFCISDTIIGNSKNTYLYRSSDGGQNWITSNWLVGSSVNDDVPCKIQWLNSGLAFLSCKAGLYRTINGGLNWEHINQLPGDIYGFYFLDSNEGYLVTNFWGIEPTLLKTVNGGIYYQWPEIMTFDMGAAGFQGYSGDVLAGYNQNVILVTDSIIYRLDRSTGIKGNNGFINNYELKQNYPNPFNPTTSINYSLPSRTNVTIKVFNLVGQEITTLVNEIMDAGEHSVSFNAGNLSSGVYLYTFTASNKTRVKKMTLVK